MQCPVDNTTLVMSERQGIEIDYCPTCRGVWLDRGEIDKIVERSQGQMTPSALSNGPQQQQNYTHREHREYDDDDHYEHKGHHGDQGHHGQHKKHKESWFSDIFD